MPFVQSIQTSTELQKKKVSESRYITKRLIITEIICIQF